MRKRAFFLAACAAASFAFGNKPDAEYYYPAGIQAGTTRRIVVGGQNLDGVEGGWVTGGGVKITSVPEKNEDGSVSCRCPIRRAHWGRHRESGFGNG